MHLAIEDIEGLASLLETLPTLPDFKDDKTLKGYSLGVAKILRTHINQKRQFKVTTVNK